MEESVCDSTSSRKYCSIPGCKRRGCKVYRFPKCSERREKWRLACKINKDITENVRICGIHFEKDDFRITRNGITYIKEDATPTKFLPIEGKFYGRPVPRRCSVTGCEKSVRDGVTMHYFPKSEKRREHWRSVCRLTKPPTFNTLICSSHFTDNDFRVTNERKSLTITAVPSVMLPEENNLSVKNVIKGELDSTPDVGSISNVTNPLYEEYDECQENSNALDKEEDILCDDHNLSVKNVIEAVCELDSTPDVGGISNMANPLYERHDECQENSNALDKEEGILCDDHNNVVDIPNISTMLETAETDVPGSSGMNSNETSLESIVEELGLFESSKNYGELDSSTAKDIKSTCCQTLPFNVLNLIKNDTQLKSFAGVTFAILNNLEKLVRIVNNGPGKCELPLRERIVLTLSKLRLNY